MKHLLFVSLCMLALNLEGKDCSLAVSLNEQLILVREHLLTVADNLPEQASLEAEKKLLAHQAALGQALQPCYGDKAAQEFADLLKLQALLTVDAINAAKKLDQKKVDADFESLRQNAIAISCQLSKINAYINFCTLQEKLFGYLNLLKIMVTDRLATKWQEDVINYSKLRAHQNDIASYIDQALSNAFPHTTAAISSTKDAQKI